MAPADSLKTIPLSYDPANSQTSASHLIYSVSPSWTPQKGGLGIRFVRFTDGITNTLLKCVPIQPAHLSEKEARENEDREALLLRAFGNNTDVLIDRARECSNHLLLSQHNLAPELLARFENGLIYRFVSGRVTSVSDLADPQTYAAVARRLGEWHGTLPAISTPSPNASYANNLWAVMEKWISALPADNEEQKGRKEELERELEVLKGPDGVRGLDGGVGNVLGHCDLLSGNVIILPGAGERRVHFIDYEYATPCERAFDLANHLSEWGGFDCEYNRIPTRSTRRSFISTYLRSFHAHKKDGVAVGDAEIDALMSEVDAFRGVPGFYWGIWALIQATISQIDFDYATYAQLRLGEYYDWKEARQSVREGRWAEE